jgi:renalase
MTATVSVAIIGAGLAALSCARHLQQAGLTPRLFEADTQPGGRVSSVRHDQIVFDDGAQFLTVRTPVMQAQLQRWLDTGVAAQWSVAGQADRWYVGVPDMRALARDLADGLDIQYATPVASLQRHGRQWRLSSPDSTHEALFDAVLVATPPRHAAALVAAYRPDWARALAVTPMLPCWTVLASSDVLPVPEQARVVSEGPISWWARDNSKPARQHSASRHHWVIQADARWSQQHASETGPEIARMLLAQFSQMVCGMDSLPGQQVHAVRYWDQARRDPQVAHWVDSLWCTDQRLGVCGDGLSHSRVEQAYVSGVQLAGQLLASLVKIQQEVL